MEFSPFGAVNWSKPFLQARVEIETKLESTKKIAMTYKLKNIKQHGSFMVDNAS